MSAATRDSGRTASHEPTGERVLRFAAHGPTGTGHREALCALGNGYLVTRGTAAEARVHDPSEGYPGTYLAGLYDRQTSRVAGHEVESEDLVNAVSWLHLDVSVETGGLAAATLEEDAYALDLDGGVLTRSVQVVDAAGRRLRLVERRLVSMDDPHVVGQQVTVTAQGWSGRCRVRAGLDLAVANRNVARYRGLADQHLDVERAEEVRRGRRRLLVAVAVTRQSRIRIAVAAHVAVTPARAERARDQRVDDGLLAHDLELTLEDGVAVTVEKVATVYTSRDRAISEPGWQAVERCADLERFGALLRAHRRAWARLWERFSLELSGDAPSRRLLALHVFHLLQTVSPHAADLDAGVPARGWHGEAYRGHVFWDELFVLPLLETRMPDLAAALLEYRWRRLPQARRLATAEGLAGACFPWQSGSDGREESQRWHLNPRSGRWVPDRSRLQRHVNHAIAYSGWQHYEVTGDLAHLRRRTGPVLIEVARLMSSLAVLDPATGRYRIRGVMGPDEYHDGYPDAEQAGIDDNAYTNVMTAWVLDRVLELPTALPALDVRELDDDLDVRAAERARWDELRHRLQVPTHDGIISQFEGFERLEPLDLEAMRHQHGDIHRLDRILEAEGDSTNRYQVCKQADVLMLLYLLADEELEGLLARLGCPFDAATDAGRLIDHYLPRTVHGSTLSRLVSAWVLARCDRRRSWVHFTRALEADVADVQGGTTAEGIHLGAMAGTVDLVQRCYAGLSFRGGALCFDPALPDEARALRFPLRYRGHRLEVAISHHGLRVRSIAAVDGAVQIRVRDHEAARLDPGASIRWRW